MSRTRTGRGRPIAVWVGLLVPALASAAAIAQSDAAPARLSGMELLLADPVQVRAELLSAVNAERSRDGEEPLRPAPALDAAARAVIDAILETGPGGEHDPSGRIETVLTEEWLEVELRRQGYQAELLAAGYGWGNEPLGRVVTALIQEGGLTISPEMRELGVAFGVLDRMPFYVFVFALSFDDHFAARTAALGDLDKVRRELLARTNEARSEERRRPLEMSTCLDRVAQAYAEEMLARGFYGHVSPEGQNVAWRVRREGCGDRRVGENLADGPPDAEAATRAWLESPGHREALLDRYYSRTGFGLAYGPAGAGLRILWVQVLGGR